MKISSRLFFVLLLGVVATACGAASSTPTVPATDASSVYTAVAATLTAQAVLPTATPQASPTPEPTEAPEPTATPEQTAANPTEISGGVSQPGLAGGATETPPQDTGVTAPAAGSSGGCDNAAFVKDVTIPDGTEIEAGETFEKTWLIQNTGTCTWSTGYAATFVSGDEMSGSETEISQTVSPGSQIKITLTLTAPDSDGTYEGYWKMKNEADTAFGSAFYVKIAVPDDADSSDDGEDDEDEDDEDDDGDDEDDDDEDDDDDDDDEDDDGEDDDDDDDDDDD